MQKYFYKLLLLFYPARYFHFQKQGATHFRIIINTTDNKSVYVAVKAEIYNSTDYQTAPVIKFFGTVLGGLS